MKIIFMSFITFFCGVCVVVHERRLNNGIQANIEMGKPLIDRRLVKMSERCYAEKSRFKKMEKRLKLEIAKRNNM